MQGLCIQKSISSKTQTRLPGWDLSLQLWAAVCFYRLHTRSNLLVTYELANRSTTCDVLKAWLNILTETILEFNTVDKSFLFLLWAFIFRKMLSDRKHVFDCLLVSTYEQDTLKVLSFYLETIDCLELIVFTCELQHCMCH